MRSAILVKNWKSLSAAEMQRSIETMSVPEPNSGCWLWVRRVMSNGYCHIGNKLAHRVSYEAFIGPIAKGMLVCHRCDTRACVNPNHLYLGTHADNMRDMKDRGRAASGDANPTRANPACLRRGDEHWTRRMPERRPHGEKNGSAKLTPENVRAIIALSASGRSLASIAREFGVSPFPIRRIFSGRSWKNIERRPPGLGR